MRYIDTIKAGMIFLVIFAGLFFFFTHSASEIDVNTIMTISTFLFAILAGFFISRLNQRYDSMRDAMATEDAYWVAIYRTSSLLGGKFAEKIAEIVDRYYLINYDHEIGVTYQESEVEVNNIYRAIENVKEKEGMGAASAIGEMVDMMGEVEKERNKIAVLAEERLTMGQWLVLVFLMAIIIFSMFYLDRSSIFMQVSAILMSTSLVMVLFIIRDLQNFRFGGKFLMEESGEQVFESIGKLRYYNADYLKEGTVSIPKHVKKYRLGRIGKDGKREIEIVER